MSGDIEGEEVNVKVDGWWSVCHQSTDFFITGIIAKPTIDKIETALSALVLSSIDEYRPINAA